MFFLYKFHKTYYNETDRVPIGHQSGFPIWNSNLAPVWACVSSAIWPRSGFMIWPRFGPVCPWSGPDWNFCTGNCLSIIKNLFFNKRAKLFVLMHAQKWPLFCLKRGKKISFLGYTRKICYTWSIQWSYWASFIGPQETIICNRKKLFVENSKVMKPFNVDFVKTLHYIFFLEEWQIDCNFSL